LTLVDLAVETRHQIALVDRWIHEQGSLVHARTRALHPAVRERQGMVAQLRQLLIDLGLKRRTKEPLKLHEYLQQRTGDNGQPATPVEICE